MRVAFLYNDSCEDPAGNAEDDAPERSPVVAALRRLGHEVTPIACTLDLATLRQVMDRVRPDVAFNRVESLGGSDAMQSAVTLLLDVLRIPYTGCPSAALVAAADKVAVKKRLVRAGLPTPDWIAANEPGDAARPQANRDGAKHIIKSVFEHGSFQIDDSSIVGPTTPDEMVRMVSKWSAEFGRPFFAERFIDGREFNLSMLGGKLLPPAEIDFSEFPRGKPRIVGRDAKWDAATFEFQNTPRRFDFPPADDELVLQIEKLAAAVWELFDLRGYARIDFRCDAAGNPWVLEINTNPCLSPESGFAAALEQAGIAYDGGIQRILEEALGRGPASIKAKARPLATAT